MRNKIITKTGNPGFISRSEHESQENWLSRKSLKPPSQWRILCPDKVSNPQVNVSGQAIKVLNLNLTVKDLVTLLNF